MEAVVYWVGGAVRGRIRALSVDPVTEVKSPEPSLPSVTIRFKNPDGTTLATHTLVSGIVNAGDGYYYGTSTPTMEGMHVMEAETGGITPGRTKVSFSVEPF